MTTKNTCIEHTALGADHQSHSGVMVRIGISAD